MDIVAIYITTASHDEAVLIASALLNEKLIACANIIDNATSLYHWEGKLTEASESLLIAKTTAARVDEITAAVKTLHSYDTPCIVALPITGGNADFLSWIKTETQI